MPLRLLAYTTVSLATGILIPDNIHVAFVYTRNTGTHTQTSNLPFSILPQILGPLDHDDQCGKQKLAYKLEQVITLMSLDS